MAAIAEFYDPVYTLSSWGDRTLHPFGWFEGEFDNPIPITRVGGASTGDTVSHTTSTVVLPSGILANDLILMYTFEQGSNGGHTFSADTGFGSPLDTSPGQSAANMAFWAKTAAGTESGATVTITSSNSNRRVILVEVLRATNGGTLTIDSYAGALSPSNGTVVIAPTVTKGYNRDCVVTFHGKATSVATTWSSVWTGAVAGSTNDTGANATGAAGGAFYMQDFGPRGATGTLSATASSATNAWGAYTIAVSYSPSEGAVKSANDAGTGTETTVGPTVTESDGETGTGTETVAQTVAESANDSGSGAETSTETVALSGTETGTGTETTAGPTVTLNAAETGAGAETIGLSVTGLTGNDTGSGADTSAETVALSSGDAGSGAETTTGPTVALSGAESGTGTETTSGPSVALSGGDAGSGAETGGGPTVALSSGDVGAGAESIVLNVTVSSGDTGSGSESGSVDQGGANKSDSETGTFTETTSLTVLITAAESGAGADSPGLTTAIPGNDTGTGTDTASAPGVTLSAAETGTGTETTGLSATGISSGDSGSGADTPALIATIIGSDSGSSVETFTLAAAIATAEAFAAAESMTLHTVIVDLDTGFGDDGQAVLVATLTSNEPGTFVDAGVVVSMYIPVDIDICVGPPIFRWKSTLECCKWSSSDLRTAWASRLSSKEECGC